MISKGEYIESLLLDLEDVLDIKITKIEVYIANLRYQETFRIATGSFDESNNLVTIVYDENGEYGVGEASLREVSEFILTHVKNDANYSKQLNLKTLISSILDERFEPHFRLSVSMATLDLISKIKGIRFGDIFSKSYLDVVDTDITIGIRSLEETIKTFEKFSKLGFRIFKIKVGEDIKKDIERVKALSEVAGNEYKFRFDANQGWNVEETLMFLDFVEKTNLNIEILEQPLPKEEFEKSNRIREKTDIPLILDESVRKSEDIMRVAKFTDGVNLKPVKAESIFELVYGYHVAKELSLLTMIGCSSESNIGITASSYIAAALKLDFADLDSDILQDNILKNYVTPVIGYKRQLPVKPGLGVEKKLLNMEKLKKIF